MTWEQLLKHCKRYDSYPSVETFFSTCPPLIRNYLTLQTFPAGQVLIQAGTPCGLVYILISGRLQGIEERAGDFPFSFFDLSPFDIVGDYELFSEDEENYVTVRALETSVCLTMPPGFYLKWLSTDSTALFFRTKLLMKRLSRQLNSNRRFLSMTYEERCMYIICQEAGNIPPVDGIRCIKLNRESLAARTGCSLRTVHRILKEMSLKKMLTLSGGKLYLTMDQLERMRLLVIGVTR